jgi:TPR repeat protein
MKKAFRYFNRARKVNCISAINSLGTVFKEGNVPFIHKDLKKAKKLFEFAASKNYVYAINNLGIMYEEEGNFQKAFELFKSSSSQGESWASNKLGQMYRLGIGTKKNIKKAFEYYNKATDATIYSVCFWSKYNLAHYFYENGVAEIGIAKDIEKSILLLEECTKHNINKAYEDLIIIFYTKYIEEGKREYLTKAKEYATIYESKDECNVKEINNIIKEIKNKEQNKIEF